jgi:chorismate dehydratase
MIESATIQTPAPASVATTSGNGFKIGVIPFLNVQPLIWGLDTRHSLFPVAPRNMGKALKEGRVDVAIAPVAASFLDPALVTVPVAGIVSKGPVQSVRLLHHRPLQRVLRLWADSNSQTSVLLTRLILKRWYGIRHLEIRTVDMDGFRAEQAGPWDAVLQIGDRALVAAPYGMTVTDLGGEWFHRTGKPFVFAVWTARDAKTADLVRSLLVDAKNEGVKHFEEISKAYRGFTVFDRPKLKEYLEKNLCFDVGPAEIEGAMEFKRLLVEEGLL